MQAALRRRQRVALAQHRRLEARKAQVAARPVQQRARKDKAPRIAALRRRIGVVHQDTQFLDHLPVAENIALPQIVAGETVDMQALSDLLSWVQLTGHSRAMPPALSGGERQRAALARAVIMSPDLVIADEPTGNLDWDMSMRLLQLLIELNRSGKAVLFATHDMNLIRAAKQQVQARVLRIAGKRLQLAGADL